jgi:hypothetical protein
MKMRNKIAALSTAAILMLTATGNVFAAGTAFKDLENNSAKDKIIALQDRGIISGMSDGVFSPDSKITAAQSIQLFVSAFGLNIDSIRFFRAPKATDYFKKAKDNAWYSQALIIGAMNGLDFPKDIDPNQNMTKEEFTYRLMIATEKYGQLPMINMMYLEYADADQVKVEYSGAIQRALKYGIVKLDADSKFNPKAELTRAEAAGQLYNALELLKVESAPASAIPSIPETAK